MKSIKRMPLWGVLVIITLLLITIGTSIYSKQEEVKPQVANETTDIITEESTNTIENEKPKTVTHTVQSKENQISEVPQETIQQEVIVSEGTSLGMFRISAYCNCSKCCGKWAGGPTASGTMPQAGRTIAVDPKVIPLGTKVIIDGHTYVSEDTGGAIKGNKIDMYFDSHSEALAWGVKYKEVILG